MQSRCGKKNVPLAFSRPLNPKPSVCGRLLSITVWDRGLAGLLSLYPEMGDADALHIHYYLLVHKKYIGII